MVNPELSRRVAKVLPVMMALGLELEERFALADRVEHASDFRELPENDRQAIQEAEDLLASGVTISDLFSSPKHPGERTDLTLAGPPAEVANETPKPAKV